MYKNFLIPVSLDEDRDVASAVAVARQLADADARITFAHVIEPVPVYVTEVMPPDIWKERRKMATERLKALSDGVPNAHSIIIDGSSGRALTDWAKDNDADCIVIASHRPVFSDMFLGSTATWVVRHAHCAVHVIR
jgi:nucleotide-binding universal stress UspA family protein